MNEIPFLADEIHHLRFRPRITFTESNQIDPINQIPHVDEINHFDQFHLPNLIQLICEIY